MKSTMKSCQCCCQSYCPNSAMPGDPSKEILVYGILKNHTLDPNRSNGTTSTPNYHNDAIAYAYQLYDHRFFDENTIENYQDMINKRLTAISYADGVTTIENRDHSKGDPYMLVVKGNTNIDGDLYLAGDIYYVDGSGTPHKIDLSDIINRLTALENSILWEVDSNNSNRIVAKANRSAAAYGFYDTDPNMQ